MRKALFASVFLIAVISLNSTSNSQLATVCVNCSTIYEELISDAKQAQQYITQVSQLQTELNQYANMITNTVSIPQQIFAGVQSDISQVRNIANAASVLSGNSGSILTRLRSAQGYANQVGYLPSNIGNQFTFWQTTLANAGTTLGQTLGLQQGQLSNYTGLQASIQSHSQTAAGQMQAIQASVEMSALTNTQLQQIQTTLVAASQEVATRNIVSADRQAMQDQQQLNFLAPPDFNTTGWARY